MGILTVIYVALAFQPVESTRDETAVAGLAFVFLCEFGLRCYDSQDRASYLRSHWLDLITAVPVPGVPGLRLLRLLRLLRFLNLGVAVRRHLGAHGWGETGLIWPSLLLFWVGSGLALYLVEHDAPGATITTFPQAMTTAFLTASTLGFSTRGAPVTPDGQLIAGVIVFFALGLWGYASSQLTQWWLRSTRSGQGEELAAVRRELELIRRHLENLTTSPELAVEPAQSQPQGTSPASV